ncbi:MAG: VWA domain-containing protein [Promethearchaeota archaeon]
MTILEVIYTNEIDKAIINSNYCKEINMYDGDLIELVNEETGNKIYSILSVHDSLPEDSIALGQNLMDNLGVIENETVSIFNCEKKVTRAKRIEIEYDSLDYDISRLKFDENFRLKMVDFLRNYYFNSIFEIFWPEENAKLLIKFPELNDTDPPFAISEFNDEIILKITQKTAAMPFNALLAIDCSGSMHKHDIKFSQMSNVLDELINIYNGESPKHKLIIEYFNSLKPKFLIDPDSYKISRIDATIIAILMFFNQKISRGLGEKCSILLYSGRTKSFDINDKTIFDPSDMTNINLISELKTKIKNPTNLQLNFTIFNKVFAELKNKVDEYSKISENPILILLLTDGKPEPKDMDKEELIFDKVRELKNHAQAIDKQIVIYTLGIGDKENVDSKLLKKIANIGYGEYFFTTSLRDLSTWFENLAKEFSINLQKVI